MNEEESEINTYIKEKLMNSKIKDKRKNEIIEIILINSPSKDNFNKNNISIALNNKNPVLPFISDFTNNKIDSNLIVISKDLIMVLTKIIYNEEDKYAENIIIPDLKKEYIKNNFHNFIIENNEGKNIISIIKLINAELFFDNYFEIEPYLDISLEEKFIIDNNKEKIFKENDTINDFNIGTPIIIKKNNKQYLVGIINNNNQYHLFNEKELIEIKKNIDLVEIKYKISQVKKLDFHNKMMNDDEIIFISQYNFNELLYLNLENSNITNEGLIGLQNKSLENLKYLNLSKNEINDEGLEYLNYLKSL